MDDLGADAQRTAACFWLSPSDSECQARCFGKITHQQSCVMRLRRPCGRFQRCQSLFWQRSPFGRDVQGPNNLSLSSLAARRLPQRLLPKEKGRSVFIILTALGTGS